MIFYGLADSRLAGSELSEVVEFFPTRKQAEEALRQVLADEPDFEGMLDVVEIDLSGADSMPLRLEDAA
jgi:hypothetical protein